jgi:hypothetical protein
MAMRVAVWVLTAVLAAGGSAKGQRQALPTDTAGGPHRTRLILKDGSYQIVMSYKVVGDRVLLVSAERAGETEEIPLALVDLDATKRWETEHTANSDETGLQRPPVLDPELAKEEADRAMISPEVAPDLRLPTEDSVLALDIWQGGPELVPLNQQQSDLNQQTGHGIFKGIINPRSVSHVVVQLKGEKAEVQLHVNDPVIYLHLDDARAASGEALTVDTHGASSAQARDKSAGANEYAIVRVDVRQDARVVTSFRASLLGVKPQDDVFETTVTPLPGGHWAKITAKEPLLIGEYCLVEVLGEKEINLGVWDFGVHPTAPENRDAIKPEKKRVGLGTRRPQD